MPNTERFAYAPDYAVPPGRTLEESMNHYGIGVQEIAEHLGLTTERIYEILRGNAPIEPEVSERLETITKIPARIWNFMEESYRKQLAKTENVTGFAEMR